MTERASGGARRHDMGRRLAIAVVIATAALATTALMLSSQTSPPPPRPAISGFYGSVAADAKANIQVGGADQLRVSHRFRPGTTAGLTSVRFAQRGGPGYSSGDGGTLRISVRPDVVGAPSDEILTSAQRAFGNPPDDWSTYHDVPFEEPVQLDPDRLYHVVFEDRSGGDSDFISVNELVVFERTWPRQPLYSDRDYAVLTAQGEREWEVVPQYTAVMDLGYADGHHDGIGYIESMWREYRTISGDTQMARQRFTVSGADRLVGEVTVRVRRTFGSDPLVLTLESDGEVVESVEIPAHEIPVVRPDDERNGAGSWVGAKFVREHRLRRGLTYSLRLSTAAGTEYTVVPVREGTDTGTQGGTGHPTGFRSHRFTDGHGEATVDRGSTWTALYEWSPVDLQFYFE